MKEADVRARLVELWGSVTGVKTARAWQPRAIQDSQLPLVAVGIGEATNESTSRDVVIQRREYVCTLYVARPAAGKEEQAEVKCEPFFGYVEAYFLARPYARIAGSTGAGFQLSLAGDSGIVRLLVNDNEYAGIIFTMSVVNRETIIDRGE